MEQLQIQNKNLTDAFKFWRAAAAIILIAHIIVMIYCQLKISDLQLAGKKKEIEYQTKLESVEHIRDLAVEQLGGMAQKVEALEAELDALKSAQAQSNNMAGGQYISLGEFTLTSYCGCERCCGKWADGITASGLPAEPGIVAVDDSIIPLGSHVMIDGQEYLVADTGGAIKGNRIDIYCNDHQSALEFGVQTAEVWVMK